MSCYQSSVVLQWSTTLTAKHSRKIGPHIQPINLPNIAMTTTILLQKNAYVIEAAHNILNELFMPVIEDLISTISNPTQSERGAKLERAHVKLLPSLQTYMVMFANEAYTRGFVAANKGNGNIDLAELL
jgi:hypothetical protein